jgi:hypothetical protein
MDGTEQKQPSLQAMHTFTYVLNMVHSGYLLCEWYKAKGRSSVCWDYKGSLRTRLGQYQGRVELLCICIRILGDGGVSGGETIAYVEHVWVSFGLLTMSWLLYHSVYHNNQRLNNRHVFSLTCVPMLTLWGTELREALLVPTCEVSALLIPQQNVLKICRGRYSVWISFSMYFVTDWYILYINY